MDVFYLGTHQPHWLWTPAAAFSLFVSRRTLSRCKTVRPATCAWALDSGGFTELSTYGEWLTSPAEYVRDVARWDREIGRLEWAAPQDHMCEPWILAKTGLTVGEHQARTVENFLLLGEIWPGESDAECPFMPVLQGWTLADYERCADRYAAAGVVLEDYPVVGLGSVCRRQDSEQIGAIVSAFTPQYAVHGFGVKTGGLLRYGYRLTSADSLAWSYAGRREPPMAGHPHKNCANCLQFAARWRERVLAAVAAADGRGHQEPLFGLEAS
jgi:hypothetical protein